LFMVFGKIFRFTVSRMNDIISVWKVTSFWSLRWNNKLRCLLEFPLKSEALRDMEMYTLIPEMVL
jgi:hypothetical protein